MKSPLRYPPLPSICRAGSMAATPVTEKNDDNNDNSYDLLLFLCNYWFIPTTNTKLVNISKKQNIVLSTYYVLLVYILLTTYYLLHTTYYLLLTTYHLLLTTYYLLLTTYYLLLLLLLPPAATTTTTATTMQVNWQLPPVCVFSPKQLDVSRNG